MVAAAHKEVNCMFDVGQEVTVINEKGVGYSGYVVARATGDDGQKAYKIAVDGGGLQQLGQWHKACDVFVLDPPTPTHDEQIPMKSFMRH
jgi:hypothetical protein